MNNNPFQNFNNKYRPDEKTLELLLSRLDSVEMPIMNNSKLRSPVYAWIWASGVSIVGATAAIIIYISGNTVAPVTMMADANTSRMEKSVHIDEALATVSAIEGVTDHSKF